MKTRNLKLSNIICFAIGISLIGCSFSKESDKTVAEDSGIRILSENQQALMQSIKQNDASMVKAALKSLSTGEKDFSGLANTPVSAALDLNLPEILQLLIQESADIHNLGIQEENFNQKVMNNVLNKILQDLKHPIKMNDKFLLNEAEHILKDHYEELSEQIINSLNNGTVESANASYRRTKLNCNYSAISILNKAHYQKLKNPDVYNKFLSELPCDFSASDLHGFYRAELIRQFQAKFSGVGVLPYLFGKPYLNLMWNIDDSNIWISPQALLRITFSESNIKVAEDESRYGCSIAAKYGDPLCNGGGGESDAFLTNMGYVAPKYELIDSRKGLLKTSYVYFELESDAQTFAKRLVIFMNGEKEAFLEEKRQRTYSDDPVFWEIDGETVLPQTNGEN